MLFFHSGNQTLDRNMRELFMFYHIYAKSLEYRVHKAFIKCASENYNVSVKLMEIIKITWISPFVSTMASLHVTLLVQEAHSNIYLSE
jgi:hypothetical protein